MSNKPDGGGNVTVGDVTNSQGVGIGNDVDVSVIGNNTAGDMKIDVAQLRAALEQLYDVLGQEGLPREKVRSTQTAAGKAIEEMEKEKVNSVGVVENVKKIGETLKEANVAVKESTSLWESVKKLSLLLGPLVGGARVVASWFGVSF